MALRYADPASEAYQFPLTIRHLLDGVVSRAGDRQIVYRDRSSYGYSKLVERIGRQASMLTALGAGEGMTIAVMDWDSHRYLEAYFAIPMMGAVLQTVNVRMPEAQIAYTLEHANAEIILVHRDFFPVIDAILPGLPQVKAVVAILDGEEGEPIPGWAKGEYEALSEAASPDYPFADFDENAIATTFYTTGTTGNPKGVCFSHRQLVLHTLVSAGAFGSTSRSPGLGVGDVYMPLTPMFHVHAWGFPYVATALALKQVYPGRYQPDMICRLRQEHGANYSHGVPTVLSMVLDEARKSGADLTGWKMIVGGSALSKGLYEEGRAMGMEIGAGYGMSETCPIVSKAVLPDTAPMDDDAAAATAFTAAGVPLTLVNAEIMDETMNPLPHDGETRGELVLRTPWLTPCYTGNAAASEALWRGGWLHTQDVATIDPQGQIRIRDRLKDVIKTGGEWIDSIELEELVGTAEDVAEASVVAIPDEKWGERPLAVVVPRAGKQPTLEAINVPVIAAIERGEITRYAKLSNFETVDALPRTSVGKIDKKALRARFTATGETLISNE